MRAIFTIGNHWLLAHKGRYTLCIFVIALSVMFLLLFYSVGSGIQQSVVSHSSLAALSRNVSLHFSKEEGNAFQPEDIAAAINAAEIRIEYVCPYSAWMVGDVLIQKGTRMVMLDASQHFFLDSELESFRVATGHPTPKISGDLLESNHAREALVTSTFLEEHGIVPNAALGMSLLIGTSLDNAIPYTVVGIIDSSMSIIDFFASDIYIAATDEEKSSGTIQSVTYCMQKIKDVITAVETLQEMGYSPEARIHEIAYSLTTHNGIQKDAVFVGITLILGSMINLVNTICRTFTENMSVIAIMETVGFRKRSTAMLSVWCGFLISSLGSLLGIALSYAMSQCMDSVLAYIGKPSLLTSKAFAINHQFVPVCYCIVVCMGIAFSAACFMSIQKKSLIERILQ